MQGKKQKILAMIAISVLVIIGACYGTYYFWAGRGDDVLFSSTPEWGWGSSPLYTADGKGGKAWLGTNYNFGFVRDVHPDPAVVQKLDALHAAQAPSTGATPVAAKPSTGGNKGAAPAGGAPGGHAGP